MDRYFFLKKLKKVKKLGYSLEQVIMVDDSPEKLRQNYGNGLISKPFVGNPQDKELVEVFSYLLSIQEVENVRKLEKRNWRKGNFPRFPLEG